MKLFWQIYANSYHILNVLCINVILILLILCDITIFNKCEPNLKLNTVFKQFS